MLQSPLVVLIKGGPQGAGAALGASQWSFYISSAEVGRTGKSAGATGGTATLGCSPTGISQLPGEM